MRVVASTGGHVETYVAELRGEYVLYSCQKVGSGVPMSSKRLRQVKNDEQAAQVLADYCGLTIDQVRI